MKIDKISALQTVNVQHLTKPDNHTRANYTQSVNSDKFIKSANPTFTSFSSEVSTMAKKYYPTEREVEQAFQRVFRCLKEDSNIQKNKHFNTIANIYERKGLRGLLHDLWKADLTPETAPILQKSESPDWIRLAQGPNDISFDIVNNGRLGFINDITENVNAPRHIEIEVRGIREHEGLPTFSLSLDKDQKLVLKQEIGEYYKYSRYYPEVGRIEKYVDGNSYYHDITYYKKNGNKDSLKTWFLGGSVNHSAGPIA